MTEQELLEKLTGVNNPRFITPREDAIIKECLAIINNIEKQLNIHSVVKQSEQLKALLERLLEENMCSVVGDELIEEALKGF